MAWPFCGAVPRGGMDLLFGAASAPCRRVQAIAVQGPLAVAKPLPWTAERASQASKMRRIERQDPVRGAADRADQPCTRLSSHRAAIRSKPGRISPAISMDVHEARGMGRADQVTRAKRADEAAPRHSRRPEAAKTVSAARSPKKKSPRLAPRGQVPQKAVEETKVTRANHCSRHCR